MPQFWSYSALYVAPRRCHTHLAAFSTSEPPVGSRGTPQSRYRTIPLNASMATESQPIDIDDESDVVDLCDKSSEDDDDSVVDLTAASPASPKRRRSVIDVDDEAVARQLELEEQRAAKRRKKAEERDARIARKLAAEEKRKAEEKKRADAIKRKNAAERAAKEKRKSVDTEELASTPTGLAAIVTEYTRDSKKWAVGLELKNACANFDLAVKFFEKHAAMLARAPCPRSGRNKGTRATPLAIVYHGTSRSNFRAIMEGNLKVPDGRTVRHVTDDGFFGRGIYTTTDPRLAFAYAKDAIVFACLALPGRQYKATQKRDRGVPKKAGYDSHLGYVLRGVREVAFNKPRVANESRRWRHSIPHAGGRRRAPARVF